MRSPLFSVQKLIEQITATFLFVKKKNNNNKNNSNNKQNKQNDRNVIERCAPSCPREKADKKINKEIWQAL